MTGSGENILFPDKSLYLIHKIHNGTSLDRISQWQTRPKSLQTVQQPSSIANLSESTEKRNIANTAKIKFIEYNKQGNPPQKRKKLPHTRSFATFHIRKKLSTRKPYTLPRQRSENDNKAHNNQHQSIREHARLILCGIPNHEVLNFAMPALSDRMSPSLSHHIILYINYYFHVIATDAYPLSSIFLFNPAKQHWFPRMLADDVWCYIILSFSARTIAKITRNGVNLQDAHSLLNEALQRLNHRMSAGYIQTDETLGAIACLANWSNSFGDHEKSWSHARGLAELVSIRGGLSTINQRLRPKMYRGILEIAVDSDNIPNTQLLSDLVEITGVTCQQNNAVVPATFPCSREMSMDLASIFYDISELSGALQNAMTRQTKLDPEYMDSTVFGLLQRLLLCASQYMSPCHNAFRICLILYIKSLTCTFERFVQTSTALVMKLRSYINTCLSTPTRLTRWKLFMGCLVAADGTPDKEWFISSLVECLSQDVRGEDGRSVFKMELSSILWIEFVHEKHTDAIWSLLTL
ncbi:hypothetical protein V8C35DRAFT_305076 [Trichoderma chlorosporum]